jgi:hypothetical protein
MQDNIEDTDVNSDADINDSDTDIDGGESEDSKKITAMEAALAEQKKQNEQLINIITKKKEPAPLPKKGYEKQEVHQIEIPDDLSKLSAKQLRDEFAKAQYNAVVSLANVLAPQIETMKEQILTLGGEVGNVKKNIRYGNISVADRQKINDCIQELNLSGSSDPIGIAKNILGIGKEQKPVVTQKKQEYGDIMTSGSRMKKRPVKTKVKTDKEIAFDNLREMGYKPEDF